ncbi:recombinase RecT [Anaerovibrio slackiae]|uniref:recombinase RecT n=1 Tax=Anaerovibrio slackiae TaxID=2652309 RepID=UPI002E26B55E
MQLAERTGQYKTINASVVYEGQIEDIDFITGNIIRGKKISDTVVGYVAYIEFLNGFSKTFYMSKEEVEAHASKYSQSYRKGYGVWKDNFDAMALKTVTKLLISKYGIMSIEMESSSLARALAADQAIMESEDETYTYADNPQDTISVEVQEPPQYARTINVNDIPPAEEPPAASIPAAEPPEEAPRTAQQGNEAESQPEECPF